MKKNLLIIFTFIALAIFGIYFFLFKTSVKKTPTYANNVEPQITRANHSSEEERRAQIMAEMDKQKLSGQELINFHKKIEADDYIIGEKKNPKVTVIFYGSLTCFHCSDAFLKIFFEDKKMKKFYQDDSGVALIHRAFISDIQSLHGVMILLCKKLPLTKHYDFLKELYKYQTSWAYKQDFKSRLENMAAIAKISTTEEIQKCFNNDNLKTKLIDKRGELLLKGGLRATPAIFINGIEYQGSIDHLSETIEKELQRKIVK